MKLKSKIAFLFSGQGSQYSGMGQQLYNSSNIARKTYEEACTILGGDVEEDSQAAILTLEISQLRAFMDETGIEPDFCAGHSLGEYASLVCSGALSFSDALQIVKQRELLMQRAVPDGGGRMAAIIGVPEYTVLSECVNSSTTEQRCVISSFNAPEQFVISGHQKIVDLVCKKLSLSGRIVSLPMSVPCHSPILRTIEDEFLDVLSSYPYSSFNYTVVSSLTARPYRDNEDVRGMLCRHLYSPTRWQDTMRYLHRQGVECMIEFGPKTVLKELVRKNVPMISAYSFDSSDDMERLQMLFTVNKPEEPDEGREFIQQCLALAVCTKNMNDSMSSYLNEVSIPYKEIEKMLDINEENKQKLDRKDIEAVLEMIKSILNGKRLNQVDSAERIEQLFRKKYIWQR